MNQSPEAIFVVERRPGQGYGITSSDGPRVQALQRAAVEVLGELGQPDPRGPEEVQRWIPNAGPDRQPLFVRIRRTPEGESIYHQAWFPANGLRPVSPPRTGWGWLIAGLVLFLVGGVLGWLGRGPESVKPSTEPVEPGVSHRGPPPGLVDPATVSRTDAALQIPVRQSREGRKKLADFLGQPGLTGWPEESDTIDPTVEVRDFRKTPRGVKIEPIYLNNDEVSNLRRLLDVLDRLP